MKDKCTLTDAELITSIREWAGKLAETGGKAWCLQVPVNFNRDPDMLMQEISNRYETLRSDLSPDKERETAVLTECINAIDRVVDQVDKNWNVANVGRNIPNEGDFHEGTYYSGRKDAFEAVLNWLRVEIYNLKSKQHG